MIESHIDKTPQITVVIDTVHGFQGDQCDMVFALFNPSSFRCQFSRFLNKEFIINVAISRARDYLIIMLPDEDTEGIDQLSLIHHSYEGSIISIIEKLKSVHDIGFIESSKIENFLLGSEKYFESNSFTNIHQLVNVYGNPEMKYMVRISGNAIDIHWENN